MTKLSIESVEDRSATVAALRREVAELRAAVEVLQKAAGTRPRLGLRALQPSPFLGQSVNLVADLVDERGRPAIAAPVTIVATWGRLRADDDLATIDGSSATLRTGSDGSTRARLLPPIEGDLSAEERDALQTGLGLLDPDAPSPREAEPGLRELARQYRWDGNYALRRAIDACIRDLAPSLLEPGRTQEVSLAWPTIEAAVLAFGAFGPNDGEVQATTVLRLRFKNWLGPWLRVFREMAQNEKRLGADLRNDGQGDAGQIVGRLGRRVRDFVADQPGLVGQQVGREVAEKEIRRFLDVGLADLPREERLTLFPALDVARQTVASATPAVFSAVVQTRGDLSKEIATRPGRLDPRVLGELDARFDRLSESVDSRLDARVNRLRDEIRTDLVEKADRQAVDAIRTRVDLQTVELARTSDRLGLRIDGLSNNIGRLDRSIVDLRRIR